MYPAPFIERRLVKGSEDLRAALAQIGETTRVRTWMRGIHADGLACSLARSLGYTHIGFPACNYASIHPCTRHTNRRP